MEYEARVRLHGKSTNSNMSQSDFYQAERSARVTLKRPLATRNDSYTEKSWQKYSRLHKSLAVDRYLTASCSRCNVGVRRSMLVLSDSESLDFRHSVHLCLMSAWSGDRAAWSLDNCYNHRSMRLRLSSLPHMNRQAKRPRLLLTSYLVSSCAQAHSIQYQRDDRRQALQLLYLSYP